METFDVVIRSLGESSIVYIPGVHLVRIFADETDRTAHMEICLHDSSWAGREAAIDSLVDLRGMFIDDLSLSYTFSTETDSELSDAARSRSAVFAAHA